MKIKEYIFVYPKESSLGGICSSLLQNQVLDEIKNGYELYGTTFYCHSRKLMCQAMVKYEEENTESAKNFYSEIRNHETFEEATIQRLFHMDIKLDHIKEALVKKIVKMHEESKIKERKLVDCFTSVIACGEDSVYCENTKKKLLSDGWEIIEDNYLSLKMVKYDS